MKTKLLLSLSAFAVLTGCETIQTPQQRQQDAARQQAASRYSEERVKRLQGQVESIEMENARLLQELQQLRNEVRSYNSQISQLNSNMQALDAKQVRELLKAALSHRGTAVIDIISPCVAFNNHDSSTKSYGYGRDHELPLHDIGWVAPADEIMIDAYAPGELQTVELHDGSHLQLRKLEAEYNPRDRMAAIQRLQVAEMNQEMVTGLIYYDDKRPSLAEVANMNVIPLAHLTDAQIRPSASSLDGLMATMR